MVNQLLIRYDILAPCFTFLNRIIAFFGRMVFTIAEQNSLDAPEGFEHFVLPKGIS